MTSHRLALLGEGLAVALLRGLRHHQTSKSVSDISACNAIDAGVDAMCLTRFA